MSVVMVAEMSVLAKLNKMTTTLTSDFQPIRLLDPEQFRSHLQRQGISGFSRTRVNVFVDSFIKRKRLYIPK